MVEPADVEVISIARLPPAEPMTPGMGRRQAFHDERRLGRDD